MPTERPHEMWAYLFRKKRDSEDSLGVTLRKVPLFMDADNGELRLIKRILHRRTYQPGEIIFQEGEAGWGMYIVESGQVRISGINRKNQEVEYANIRENEFFGEFALIHSDPRTATAVALEPSVLLGFFKSDLQELIEKQPKLGCKILMQLSQVLGRRLDVMNDKLKLFQAGLPPSQPNKRIPLT